GQCLANTFSVSDYIEQTGIGKFPLMAKKEFDLRERARYYFMMGLFSSSLGLEIAETVFDGKFQKTLWKEILGFKIAGALQQHGKVLRLTPKGLYFWVVMMREFFTGVNNFREICRASKTT
ncbi:MAG: coproporphyrinogen III oxidase, partial [Pseudomonadota bacterium]